MTDEQKSVTAEERARALRANDRPNDGGTFRCGSGRECDRAGSRQG